MSLEYDQYLAEHIGNVNVGLHWMMDNLPLNQTQMDAVTNATLTAHDESKFSKEEYEVYDKYFYGGNKSYEVCRAFDQAWLHHIHQNPHHWQYWVLINDDPDDETLTQLKTLPMPLNFIFEMIADWWTFSWRNGNLFEIFKWYGEHRERMFLHFDTRMIVEDILQKMWKVLVMTEVRRGKDRDELEKQYISYWIEPVPSVIKLEPIDPRPVKLVFEEPVVEHSDNDFMETAGPDDAQMTGIKGMRWGVRNGPPYPLGDKEKLDSIKNLNDLMNNGWDYGVLDHGKHVLDTEDYDWDNNYRTTPIDILEKEKIGTCWDFVNYQHDKLKNMGIKDNSYLITIQKSDKPDDIVTHTFTTFELGDKKYWLESAAWPKRGVHEINGIEDVAKELNEMYHSPGLGLSIFEYNPEGMDKGLTSNEFFDKASQNLVYDEEPIKHSDTEGDEDLYGVPELKKFPMPDKKHVKSAIRFFNYVDPKHERKLAEAILEKAEEFGMDLEKDISVGDENRFRKYMKKEET